MTEIEDYNLLIQYMTAEYLQTGEVTERMDRYMKTIAVSVAADRLDEFQKTL